jgi:predicted PurR-regulated permease PerM
VLTVAVLTIYLLIDGPRVGMGLMQLLPRTERLPARQMLAEIAEQVGGYMRGQFITSALAGLFAFGLLLVFRVPEPLALAFLMAVADAIPMVGPLLATVPAVLMALTRGGPTALAVGIGYVLYLQFESHLLVPRIYGKTMKLSPSVIVIAILIGATLMGILGALLALPVAAAVPVVLRFVGEWREREAQL